MTNFSLRLRDFKRNPKRKNISSRFTDIISQWIKVEIYSDAIK